MFINRFTCILLHSNLPLCLHIISGSNPCELNCMPKGERFYYRHARKVIDGTRCYEDGSLDVCVDGICMVCCVTLLVFFI